MKFLDQIGLGGWALMIAAALGLIGVVVVISCILLTAWSVSRDD